MFGFNADKAFLNFGQVVQAELLQFICRRLRCDRERRAVLVIRALAAVDDSLRDRLTTAATPGLCMSLMVGGVNIHHGYRQATMKTGHTQHKPPREGISSIGKTRKKSLSS